MVDGGELYQDRPCGLAGGDLDGDGDMDAVVMVGYQTIELLMDDEEEGWVRTPLPELSGSRLLGVGDADGDGDADVWFNGGGGEEVCVLVNQGSTPGELRYWRPDGAPTGAFPFRLVRGLGPSRVTGALWGGPVETLGQAYVVGYLDVDGVVVGEHLGPAPYLLLQGLADLDGDGDVDVLLDGEVDADTTGLYRRGLQLLRNQGDGTWEETDWQPEARLLCPPTLSDIDGDGLIDVVWADVTLYEPGVVVALGQSGGLPRIEGRYLLSGAAGGPVLAGDVNGDGGTDLVVLEQYGYDGNGVHVLLNRSVPTAVTWEGEEGGRLAAFLLGRSYPNPFNPQTLIPLEVPAAAGPVRLQVYDVLGRSVRELVGGSLGAGLHLVPWDGRDESGAPVAAGVYLVRLEAGGQVQVGKMVRVE